MSNTITAVVTSQYFKNTDAEVDEREAGTLETEAKVERKPEHRSTRLRQQLVSSQRYYAQCTICTCYQLFRTLPGYQ